MLRKSFVLLLMGSMTFFLCSVSSADVPDSVNYQGKLTTASGGCLNDTVQMTFAIYADAFGTVLDWSETQTQVEVKEGIFNVLLGSVNPLPASIFDGTAKYLGVQVESDPEMSPLKPMVTTAYAFGSHHAQEADTADYARGAPAVPDGDWTISGSDIYRVTGKVGIGTSGPLYRKLNVSGDVAINSNSNYAFEVANGPQPLLRVDGVNNHIGLLSTYMLSDGITIGDPDDALFFHMNGIDDSYFMGDLGVGKTSPDQKLDVAGTAQMTGFKMPTGAGSGKVLTSDASGVGTWQDAAGGIASVDGVSNPGGDVDFVQNNSITITPNDGANTVTFGETHSARTDNPHSVTAAQTGALVSVDGVSNAGGDVDFVAGSNMTITPNDAANTVTFSAAATGIGGSGTANYIPKFTAPTTVGNSAIYQGGIDYVGIGTTSPSQKLGVLGNIALEGSGASQSFSLDFRDTGGSEWMVQYSGSGLSFWEAGIGPRMVIEDGGQVGIGTTSPGYLLHVNGNLYAGTVNTGLGDNELYAMNQNVRTSDNVSFGAVNANYVNTGYGNNELYAMNQNVRTTDAVTFATLNTGQGNNELYAMNQNVRTSDNPTFNQVHLNDYGTALGGFHVGGTSDPGTDHLIVDGNAGIGVTPADKLDVNGDIRVRGADINDAGGTSRITLTDNGSLTLREDGGAASLTVDNAGDVGIGTTSPSYQLHVLSSDYNVVRSEFTGAGGDARAFYGESTPADYYGFGGEFRGGYKGVYGAVSATGTQTYYGVHGYAYTSGAGGTKYGVYGYAGGSGTNYGVYYSNGLGGSGSKSCIVKTSQGPTALYCQESPENWFEDFGEGALVNGQAHIGLDALFLETVTINAANPMKVFVQLEGDCNGVYVSKGTTGFDVFELKSGTSNVPFSYRVVAKRKGFEGKRLEYTKAGENDPYLYPEAAERMEKERLENAGEGATR